jgi:5-methylcytosine-specific restriction protein B
LEELKEKLLYEDLEVMPKAMSKLGFTEEEISRAEKIYLKVLENIPEEVRKYCFLRYNPKVNDNIFTCIVKGKHEYRILSLPYSRRYPLELICSNSYNHLLGKLVVWEEFKAIDCCLVAMTIEEAEGLSSEQLKGFSEGCRLANNLKGEALAARSNTYFKTWMEDEEYHKTYTRMLEQNISKEETVKYYWLNCNPNYWDLRKMDLGELCIYTSHNEKGNKRNKYKHFQAVKPGDILIGYITTPDKEVAAICEITKGLHESVEGEGIEFKKIENIENPISFEVLKGNQELQSCEPIVNNQGSLFGLTEEEYQIIRAVIDEKNINVVNEPPAKYEIKDALSDLFVDEVEYKEILELLKYKKNIILQGPPGVGKTFIAKRIAYSIMGEKNNDRIEMIQFHQSYSYEDFVQGYKPTESGNFERVNGVFYEFCRRAQRDRENQYFFIIDEINRGNLSKIFGELMMLMENTKRGKEFEIPLTYSRNNDEKFYIPENLYIIGTMNTADRSLAMVDYALRRRFGFFSLKPFFNSEKFKSLLFEKGVNINFIDTVIKKLNELNERIINDKKNLGPGFEIGHSYFCPVSYIGGNYLSWYKAIIKNEIKPLLEEYWFDDTEKVDKELSKLLE